MKQCFFDRDWNSVFKKAMLLLMVILLSACTLSQATPLPATPAAAESWYNFSEAEAKTLSSLKQIDDYPFYIMQYYQDDTSARTFSLPPAQETDRDPSLGCSLFAVLLDEDHLLFGRNFDFKFSPALLVFTDPSDGYASVSMTDIAFLNFSNQTAARLMDLPLEERAGLLGAQRFSFDGMNEHGLVIALAAVPQADTLTDPTKKRVTGLELIREVLDHARDVDEAVELIRGYNVDLRGGLPLHYLLADANGKAVLVEFYQGEMRVLENEQPWHSATNFVRSAVEDPQGQCWRYDRINERLNERQGLLDSALAMELLDQVAQKSGETPTQWSVVYQMARKEMSIVIGMDYANVQTFRLADLQLSDYWDPE